VIVGMKFDIDMALFEFDFVEVFVVKELFEE